MFKDLRKTFRNLIGEKSYPLINILGLKAGIIGSLLLLLYIVNELASGSDHRYGESSCHVEFHMRKPDTYPQEQLPVAEAMTVRQEQYRTVDIPQDVLHNADFTFDAHLSTNSFPMFRLQASCGRVMVKFESKMPTVIWDSPRHAAPFIIIGLIVFLAGKKRQ